MQMSIAELGRLGHDDLWLREGSTDGQSLASQDAQLHAAGCAKVYAEKVAAPGRTAPSSPRCSSASEGATC